MRKKRLRTQEERLAAALDYLTAWGINLEELRSFETFLVDTSALTNAHSELIWLVREGYVTGVFYLPGWVPSELSRLSSSGRLGESEAGNRGLANLAVLQGIASVTFIVDNKQGGKGDPADLLVALAKRHDLKILTADKGVVEKARSASITALNTSRIGN